MASSLINTECKRYGCIKNLLACYANCRYNSRCDELRNEIEGKTEQAANDINRYLTERGGSPIAIQFLKRGLKFVKATPETGEAIKPRQPKAHLKLTPLPDKLERRPKRKKESEIGIMERKSKRVAAKPQAVAEAPSAAPMVGEPKPEKRSAKSRQKSRKSHTSSNSNGRAVRRSSKTYIILEGKSATVVDERGLMQHILSGSSNDARYFEATEVEARLQIVAMR